MKGGDIIHRFKAIITHVVDGDTVDADVYHHFLDLEFKVKDIRFRLLDIDTPEMRGDEREEGIKSKAFVEDMILGKEVQMESHEKDAFGRYLAYIWYRGINVNELLIQKGLAVPYEE